MCPSLFTLGSRTITGYGFFITLGFGVSIGVILILARRLKLPVTETAAFLLFGVTAAILGGRIYIWGAQLLGNLSYYLQSPHKVFQIPFSGGAFHGSVITGLLFSLWYLKRFHLPLWKVADITAVGTVLGFSLARIGCFMGGCCYGRPSSLPWAVQFPHLPEPVHPTQLYESGLNLLNFAFLLYVLRNKKFDGQLITWDIMLNCSIRFGVEYFRGDPGRGYLIRGAGPLSSLSTPQAICLLGLGVGAVLYSIRKRAND